MNYNQTTAQYEIEYTLRKDFRTNTLNKKQSISILDSFIEKDLLQLVPNTDYAMTSQVAEFFEVDVKTIETYYRVSEKNKEHREELLSDGMIKKTNKEIKEDANSELSSGLKISPRGSWVFPKRAILRLAMVLQSSEVAKEIRTLLLDMEKAYATGKKLGFDSDEFKLVDMQFDETMLKLAEQLDERTRERHHKFSQLIHFKMLGKGKESIGDIEKYNELFKKDNYMSSQNKVMKLTKSSGRNTIFYAVFNYLMFKETEGKLSRKDDIRKVAVTSLAPHVWSEYDKVYTWVDNQFETLDAFNLPYPTTVELAERCFASMKRQDVFKMMVA